MLPSHGNLSIFTQILGSEYEYLLRRRECEPIDARRILIYLCSWVEVGDTSGLKLVVVSFLELQ